MTAQQPGAVPFFPGPQGLFDPKREYDACGVGFIADLKGGKSHKLVEDALAILCNVEHRGAVGADPIAGDGAGILIQIPHDFLAEECAKLKIKLPKPGHYAVGHVFMPQDERLRAHCERVWMRIIREEGLEFLGWRSVPVDNSCLSEMVKAVEPMHRQIFIGRPESMTDSQEFERRLYLIRKVVSNALYYAYKDRDIGHYTVSLSSRTLVYKGMFLSYQVPQYYKDLTDPRLTSAMALVHQRFSTNTFPSWKLAHPYRMVAHNGEINTLRGNVNWMAARQASVSTPLFGSDISKLWPISYEGQSDTACFDNALEFLVMGGYSLAHAAMMLIPEAWAGNPLMDAKRRAFYEYHACLMEPWDGPAAMAFTDGRQIGATLDRNGLRPARYLVTKDDRVIMSSEAGVLPVPEENIARKWRLQPGKMLLIDMEQGKIISDDDLKADLASRYPYEQWLKRTQIQVGDLPLPKKNGARKRTNVALLDLQQMFGYTQESLKFLMAPMAHTGQEAVGSMGNDTPVSVLSSKPKLLHTYFKQNFAQVTNPPIDSIREELVMSLVSFIGPRPNLLDLEGTAKLKRLEVYQPILSNEDLERIRQHRPGQGQPVLLGDDRHHLSGREGRRRHDGRARRGVRGGRGGRALARVQHHHPVRPRRGPGPHPDPVAARHLGRAPSPDPPGPAHQGGPGGGDRRGARGAPVLRAGRLRRGGHQPLSRLRDAGAAAARARRAADPQGGAEALHQGDRQGAAEGDVQDGHLHLPVLLRRPDLRRGRPQVELREEVLHRHAHPGRRRRPAPDRARDRRAPPPGLRQRAGAGARPRRGRRVRLPHPRRGAHVAPQRGRRPAARGARQPARQVPLLRPADQRPVRAADDAARPVPHQERRGACAASRCRWRRSSRPPPSSSASPPAP